MKKLTILLSLKDRHEETETWISNNYFDDFVYIIADGSLKNYNYEIFQKFKKQNINYFRYNPDNKYSDYYTKVYNASLKIETPFVIQVDNDDVINKKGIDLCLKKIETNSNIKIINGFTGGFNKFNTKYKISDFKENNCEHLTKKNLNERINSYLENYRIIWYSIFSTEIFQKAWKDCVNISCENVLHTELVHGLSSLTNGEFYFCNTTTYLRRTNPLNSIYRNLNKKDFSLDKRDHNVIAEYFNNKNLIDKSNILNHFKTKNYTYKKRNLIFKTLLYFLRKKKINLKQMLNIVNKLNFIS